VEIGYIGGSFLEVFFEVFVSKLDL
jgi:hypothetical protein